ncbi:MAG: outer membrane protein assembly factor BamA, partial [candidate division Zixibacteria bacterium]|nr:outer membrane protein assembly factor BamA [candidate division Zixibacteria bacterium]
MLRRILFIFVFIILVFSYQLSSAIVISQIEVEGNRSVDKSLIINMSGLKAGSELDPTTIQDAIKRLYAMRLFSDIQIEGKETEEGMELYIKVREYPKVSSIEISGNKKIKTDDIKEKLNIILGKVISPMDVKADVDNIKSIYREKGYLAAQIESEVLQSDKEGKIVLRFKIKEGKKVRIKKIFIEGNQVFKDKKIKKQMKNKEDRWWRGGGFDPEKFEEDKERIVEFYKKKGYLDAGIISDSVWYGPSSKDMFIKIVLTEGDRYKFGKISWEGNKLFSAEKLNKLVKFKKGEIYNQEKYEKTLGNIYSVYQEEGHIYVMVEDNTTTRDSIVNIDYQITEGMPANVRKINIQGNTKTKEKVIRRELSILPGERFRRSFLMRSIRDVMYLNFFANVEPDYEVLENGDIDLSIKVEEKPTGQFMFGAGYGARDKWVGNIGLGIPNLFGNGQNLKLNWDFGKRRQTVEFSFTEPWFRATPTSVGFDIYQINRKWYEEFTEETQGFALRLGRRLSWPDSFFRIFWRYRWEKLRYYDFAHGITRPSYPLWQINLPLSYDHIFEFVHPSSYVHPLALVKWPRKSASTSFTILRDSRDLPQFATKGSVFSWYTEFAAEFLGGNLAYHKHIFEARYYLKTFWKFVLVFHAKVGVLDGRDREAPEVYGERFSPGGTDPDGMIRGYSDGSIGPVDSQGRLLRGRSVLVYNIKYQFPIVEQQIYGLFFADAGNAWLSGRAI